MSDFWLSFSKTAVTTTLTPVALAIILAIAARRRSEEPLLKDGWYYLTPGVMCWFATVGSAAIAALTIIVLLVALGAGWWPQRKDIGVLCMGGLLMLGFGSCAIAAYTSFFRNRVRWNDECIEKIRRKSVERFRWTEVDDNGYDPVLDRYWVASRYKRLNFWNHMNGVKALLCKAAGKARGVELYERGLKRR
jgi:hypothetical protein